MKMIKELLKNKWFLIGGAVLSYILLLVVPENTGILFFYSLLAFLIILMVQAPLKVIFIAWISYYALKQAVSWEILLNSAIKTIFSLMSLIVIVRGIGTIVSKNRKSKVGVPKK